MPLLLLDIENGSPDKQNDNAPAGLPRGSTGIIGDKIDSANIIGDLNDGRSMRPRKPWSKRKFYGDSPVKNKKGNKIMAIEAPAKHGVRPIPCRWVNRAVAIPGRPPLGLS